MFQIVEVNLSSETKLSVVKMLIKLLSSDDWLLFTGSEIILSKNKVHNEIQCV